MTLLNWLHRWAVPIGVVLWLLVFLMLLGWREEPLAARLDKCEQRLATEFRHREESDARADARVKIARDQADLATGVAQGWPERLRQCRRQIERAKALSDVCLEKLRP